MATVALLEEIREASTNADLAQLKRILKREYTAKEAAGVKSSALEIVVLAAWTEGYELMVSVGADPKEVSGRTLAVVAAGGGNVDFVQHLVDRGFDVRGKTPGASCCCGCCGCSSCCGGVVCWEDGYGGAACGNHGVGMDGRDPDPGRRDNVLYTAVAAGNVAMVRVLLEAGANPNVLIRMDAGHPGLPPEHRFDTRRGQHRKNACGEGYVWEAEPPLRAAVRADNFDMTKLLLEYGADPLLAATNSAVLDGSWMVCIFPPISCILFGPCAAAAVESSLGYSRHVLQNERMTELLEAAGGQGACCPHICCVATETHRVDTETQARLDAVPREHQPAEERKPQQQQQPAEAAVPTEARAPIYLDSDSDGESAKKTGKKSASSKRELALQLSVSSSSSSASTDSSTSTSTSVSDSREVSSDSDGALPAYADIVAR